MVWEEELENVIRSAIDAGQDPKSFVDEVRTRWLMVLQSMKQEADKVFLGMVER